MRPARNLLMFAAVIIIGLPPVVAAVQGIASYSPVTDQRMLKPEPPNWSSGSRVPHAVLIEIVPTIMAGEKGGKLGDSPAMRMDPNTSTSPFAGVGSLLAHFPEGFFGFCSGAAITPRHVLTAGYCLADANGNPGVAPEDVMFVLNVGGDQTHMILAEAINIHLGFTGLPDLRFDLAILTLDQDLPPEVPTYDILRKPLPLRTVITLAGYGFTGDGHTGIASDILPTLSVKRWGQNVIDFIGGPGRPNENMFFYDFDAPKAEGLNVLGGLSLGNRIETSPLFGDSGSPSFVTATDGSLLVAGVNTFVFQLHAHTPQRHGTFGEGGGGIVVPTHAAWIDSITGPSPGSALAAFAVDASDTSTALISDLDGNYVMYSLVRSFSGRCGRIGTAPCIDVDREVQ